MGGNKMLDILKELPEDRITYSKHEFFMSQAPCWAFEYDEEQLLQKGLDAGFITKIGDDEYLQNNSY